jgi:hypothetical protein
VRLIFPVVNLNGDNRDLLLEELSNVREKLEVATKALQAASYANGRNYQLNPAGDKTEAYAHHCERVQMLERIAHELLEIQYEVSNQ